MAKTKSDICDELGLSIVQGHSGWSDLLIVAPKGQIVHCRISTVFTDDTASLISLAKAVLDNLRASVDLMDEPGGHRLSICPDPEQHHLMTFDVSAFHDPRKSAAPPLLSMQIKRKQVLTLLMAELWKLNLFHQEPSFQRRRQSFDHGEHLRHLNSRWDADPQIGPSILKWPTRLSSESSADTDR